MLVGIFMGTSETTLEKYPGWMKFFMVILFLIKARDRQFFQRNNLLPKSSKNFERKILLFPV